MTKVITYGSFDLFHEGHLNILKRAKALGDYLIVGVTTEQYDESRGKLNIVDSLDERIENVRKTGLVDQIIVEDHLGQKVEDIQKYGVDIFTLGSDWEGQFDYLNDFCKVIYLPRTKHISSSLLRVKNHPIIRLGIIGTGRIARRFMGEAKFVSGVSVSAVYNPHKSSAEKFGNQFQLETATDNLDAFFDAVDAVYVASPHQTHFEYSKQALSHKKHVLCEKPLAFSESDAEALYEIASSFGVVLLEGIKTAYCPGFVQMMSLARSGVIGSVRDVEACFTRLIPPTTREFTDTEYGGCFTEYGSYTLLPMIKLFGKEFEEVRFDSIFAENGVDIYTKASLKFNHGFALSKTGLGVKSEGQLIIAGTKGYILAPSPWWLTKEFEVRYEDSNKIDRYAVKFLGAGLRYELSDFVHLINGNGERAFKLTAGESIAMARVMEKFMDERKRLRGNAK
ncbi:MAG: Gfo/Idh/MocA family oxidoreductase [Treponema sp.]|nr:Gfo/Idh/MocA family oxidoreductase [Treponema sp.]